MRWPAPRAAGGAGLSRRGGAGRPRSVAGGDRRGAGGGRGRRAGRRPRRGRGAAHCRRASIASPPGSPTLPGQGIALVPPSLLLRAADAAAVADAALNPWPASRPLEPVPGYRPCVGVFLLNDQGRVLVGQRRDMAEDAWQMPQGGIDPPETPVEAGLREMLEEIGTDRARAPAPRARVWRSYDLPPDRSRARAGAAAMPARPRNGWPIASPAATPTSAWTRRIPSSAPGAGSHPEDGAGPDRAVQARRLSQRRRRVPSPMGLTMIVDGIGRGPRRSSAGGSPGAVGEATGGGGATATGGGSA